MIGESIFSRLAGLFLAAWVAGSSVGAVADPGQIEFFESKIRPILAQECYECHSEATKAKGGLLLDTRAGWEKGGDSGRSVIVPGNPRESLLYQSIRHEIEDLEMPKAGAKLEDAVLSDFRKWIEMGAPDPRNAPPSQEQLSEDTNWEAIRDRRKGWWSFQPVRKPEVPGVEGATHPVDAFVRKKLEDTGLEPGRRAAPHVLLRRISFLITGLPPSPEELDPFVAAFGEDPDRAIADLVDRKIADPAFGEKWARHWMDWIRYADSHGSEGDPTIPHAWRYRDYLIRAWNEDLPYDQLVLEHLAGDLLPEPRINPELGINESAIGPAHLRMVFHGFAPTDALDERVRFTDDQVNAVTKAFLGLTVSCARCHDHKFDAISQKDFYALFGIFTAPLPATVAVDAPGVLTRNRDRLIALKPEIRKAIATDWQSRLESGRLNWDEALREPEAGTALDLIAKLEKAGNPAELWSATSRQVRKAENEWEKWKTSAQTRHRWEFGNPETAGEWTTEGEGLLDRQPAAAGAFALQPSGDQVIAGIFPSGIYSHLLSTRHRGFLATPAMELDGKYDLHVRMAGEGSSGRFAVQHYPRRGTVYPVTNLSSGEWQWTNYSRLDYWEGDSIHLEFATAGEAPILVSENERSWFGVRDAWLVEKGAPLPTGNSFELLSAFVGSSRIGGSDGGTISAEQGRARLEKVLGEILSRWSGGDTLSDAEAILLDSVVEAGLLPNDLASFAPVVRDLLEEFRKLEGAIPLPTRAPGVIEHSRHEQPLYDRGDHTKPLEIVPARFLEAIDETPYQTDNSGRLELARDLFRNDNPFTARVIVNRIWYHLFGNGLVATMDNFGRLGEEPSHPRLLDFLATRFREDHQWSLQSLIRDLVLTETWLQESEPSSEAVSLDPENRLLSHFSMRRLEAEAIRDSILAVSGSLEETRYGPPVNSNATRRSVYLRVKRNNLDPLLTTFDFPTPATTVGKRSSTNVPAQSLTLLNDRFIIEQAGRWAGQVLAELPDSDEEARIGKFFRMALGREPREEEAERARAFLADVSKKKKKVEAEREQLSLSLSEAQEERRMLIEPVRLALLEAKSDQEAGGQREGALEAPKYFWDFSSESSTDNRGVTDQLIGSARIEDGALILDGNGFLATGPLPESIGEKSLYAKVQLATEQQRGGGVITLQDTDGGVFDSLVYAESAPGEWLAGSNHHSRTLSFESSADRDALERPVTLVITYESDGTIRAFRDGEPWGKPIRKGPLQAYAEGDSRILLGLRHGAVRGGGSQGNRNFRGRVFEAGLYKRALQPEEVRALSGDAVFVSPAEINDALTKEQRKRRDELNREILELESRLAEYAADAPAFSRSGGPWHDFAHAMFNLKEFIYLR